MDAFVKGEFGDVDRIPKPGNSVNVTEFSLAYPSPLERIVTEMFNRNINGVFERRGND